jgi:aspartate racemase
VNLAGEPLRSDLVKQLYQLPKIKRVNDLYGPSEDTTYSTYVRRHSDGPTTIGRPIANTQLYLLDANLQPVPIGVSGEIYLGGSGLARGYVKRPELTAQAFVPDPFSGKPGARLYKTGDLARYLPDGNVEYLGRLDHQVKVRGFRIELGEIETVLREHSSVRDVVVVAREGKLIAYVVTFEEQSDNCAELWSQLRSLVKSKLPEYMLPAAFVELDTLPFTTSGKVDRNNLPTPDESRPELQQAYVAPRDRIEEQLVMLWANVLKLKTVGVLDNFFELGGHSLLAARLFAQIENRFGKHLPLATLFRSPTIAQLAKVLRDEGTETSWSSLIAIQPEGTKPPLFCIHAAGANVLIYRPLSRHLGNEQPVYALQAQGLDGQSQPLTTVEEMAARYIKEIRAFQPQGPYHLLGASFGGLVIYEMACQLRQQNQNVGLVAMLNTNCPVYSLGKRVASHVAHLRQLGPRSYGMAVVKGMARRFNRYLPDSLKFNGGANGALRPEFELKQLLETRQDRDEALVQTVSAILRAEETYDPRAKIYPGKLTLFRAIDANNELDDNRLGWKYFAQEGLEVYDVPGTHTSIREEPNVAVLAEKLKYCLDRVQLTTTQAI